MLHSDRQFLCPGKSEKLMRRSITSFAFLPGVLQAADTPAFAVKLETVMKHDDGKFLRFHPRAAAIPGGAGEGPTVTMTIQKHLKVSDFYSDLPFMTREGVDGPWTGPVLTPELDWTRQDDGVTVSVAEVTPGWHGETGKLIAIGDRRAGALQPGGEAAQGCEARS
jgi:hypothetical protein